MLLLSQASTKSLNYKTMRSLAFASFAICSLLLKCHCTKEWFVITVLNKGRNVSISTFQSLM